MGLKRARHEEESTFLFCLTHLFGGPSRELEDTLARLLVSPEALINGCSHFNATLLAFMGPLGKLDFGHQLRSEPMRASSGVNLDAEGIFIRLQFQQPLPECI